MNKNESFLLLSVVCIISTCGLIYELVAGTLASYLMGDSVRQFSFIIGIYLFAMGIGAYLSKYIVKDLFDKFISIEYLVGIIGGISSIALLALFQYSTGFQWILYTIVSITGILVGVEIPLLMRLLKDSIQFEQLVSRVFTFDYIGALLASIVFPLLFIPHLGLTKTSLFFGMVNICTGIITAILFKSHLKRYKALLLSGTFCLMILIALFVQSERITSFMEGQSFPGKIIYATSTSYQRIIITRNSNDIRLFLNGNLQFSSVDEHRYHEALVHPAMQGSTKINSILVLGGGDGLAVRELLKYKDVQHITLVDLDQGMTTLFQQHQALTFINQKSLLHPKVQVINADAFSWLRNNNIQYDCIIVDFPDPSNFSIAKLYTNTFYNELSRHLVSDGWAVIQCTSPYAAKNSFWTIDTTIRSAGFNTIPYYNTVPSFGIWGYILCSKQSSYNPLRELPQDLKFYTYNQFALMREFPSDMKATKTLDVNKLNNQSLVTLFEEEWNNYLQ
jgi:spermidine synthase